MKKTLLTIVIISNFFIGYSQDNSTNQEIKAVNKQIKQVDNDLKLDIDALRKELVSVKLDLAESKKLILLNTGFNLKTNEAKLNQRKHLIVKTTEFVKTANKSFNAIDASI